MKNTYKITFWSLALTFAWSALANPLFLAPRLLPSLLTVSEGRTLVGKAIGVVGSELTNTTRTQNIFEDFLQKQPLEVIAQIIIATQAINNGARQKANNLLVNIVANTHWERGESPHYAEKGLLERMGPQPPESQNTNQATVGPAQIQENVIALPIVENILGAKVSDQQIMEKLLDVAQNSTFSTIAFAYLLQYMPKRTSGRADLTAFKEVANKMGFYSWHFDEYTPLPYDFSIIYHALKGTTTIRSTEKYAELLPLIGQRLQNSRLWRRQSEYFRWALLCILKETYLETAHRVLGPENMFTPNSFELAWIKNHIRSPLIKRSAYQYLIQHASSLSQQDFEGIFDDLPLHRIHAFGMHYWSTYNENKNHPEIALDILSMAFDKLVISEDSDSSRLSIISKVTAAVRKTHGFRAEPPAQQDRILHSVTKKLQQKLYQFQLGQDQVQHILTEHVLTADAISDAATSIGSSKNLLRKLVHIARNYPFTPETLRSLLDSIPRGTQGLWRGLLHYSSSFITDSSLHFDIPLEGEIIYYAVLNTTVEKSSEAVYAQALPVIKGIVRDSLFWQTDHLSGQTTYSREILNEALNTLRATHEGNMPK